MLERNRMFSSLVLQPCKFSVFAKYTSDRNKAKLLSGFCFVALFPFGVMVLKSTTAWKVFKYGVFTSSIDIEVNKTVFFFFTKDILNVKNTNKSI